MRKMAFAGAGALAALAGTAQAQDPIVFDSGYVCISYYDAANTGANAPTRLGWSSGNLPSVGRPQRWVAMGFTLAQSTHITRIDSEGFIVGGSEFTNLNWRIWRRQAGNPAPTTADEVTSGSAPFDTNLLDDPRFDPNNPNGNLQAIVEPTPTDFTLPAGNYWLSVYGDIPLVAGTDANWAWFTNAQLDVTLTPPNTPIPLTNAGGAYAWRSATYPSPGFAVYQLPTTTLTIEPSPVSYGPDPQDPQYLYNAAFQIRGTAGSTTGCYANCDHSTNAPVLNVNDFICFQTAFAAGQSYANCDGSTSIPVLNVNDFICFQTQFAAGCTAP